MNPLGQLIGVQAIAEPPLSIRQRIEEMLKLANSRLQANLRLRHREAVIECPEVQIQLHPRVAGNVKLIEEHALNQPLVQALNMGQLRGNLGPVPTNIAQ